MIHIFDDSLSGRFDTTYQGVKALAVYNTLKNGWKTVSIFPYESIIKDAKSLSQLIIKVSLAFIGVALLLIYITASLFSKRIRTLIRMIRRIERGDFTPTHEEQLGSDEIGQLHFAFQQMTIRLRSLITEVYQKNCRARKQNSIFCRPRLTLIFCITHWARSLLSRLNIRIRKFRIWYYISPSFIGSP